MALVMLLIIVVPLSIGLYQLYKSSCEQEMYSGHYNDGWSYHYIDKPNDNEDDWDRWHREHVEQMKKEYGILSNDQIFHMRSHKNDNHNSDNDDSSSCDNGYSDGGCDSGGCDSDSSCD